MFYEINSAVLIKQVEAWMDKRDEAQEAFCRLSRRVGASRNRYVSGDSFGSRRFAFIFNKEPDRKHWKKSRHGDWWEPKRSSKTGKAIAGEIRSIELNDGGRSELSELFGITDFWKQVGIQKVGEKWIVTIGEGWDFSIEGLTRISDVDLEELQAKNKEK